MGVTPQPVHEGTPAVWDENRMLSVRRRLVYEDRCVERRGSMNSIACAATSRQATLRIDLGTCVARLRVPHCTGVGAFGRSLRA